MTPFRIVFVLCSLLALGGAGYLSHRGIWRDSLDLDRSVRVGSHGGALVGARVK